MVACGTGVSEPQSNLGLALSALALSRGPDLTQIIGILCAQYGGGAPGAAATPPHGPGVVAPDLPRLLNSS